MGTWVIPEATIYKLERYLERYLGSKKEVAWELLLRTSGLEAMGRDREGRLGLRGKREELVMPPNQGTRV